MTQTIFTGEQARKFLPDIGDDKAKVITPVIDTMVTGSRLGHIIIYKYQNFLVRNGKYYGTYMTSAQLKAGFTASFIFIGNNGDIFNHLFHPKFSGKVNESGEIIIDKEYNGIISNEFRTILKNFLMQFK